MRLFARSATRKARKQKACQSSLKGYRFAYRRRRSAHSCCPFSRVASKEVYLFSFNFLVVEIRIFIMLLSSSNISWNLLSGAIFVSIIVSIQYLHSEASFKAIEYLDKKSTLDWANSASAYAKQYLLGQFAPMLVPERRNCLDKTFAASSKCFLLSCT